MSRATALATALLIAAGWCASPQARAQNAGTPASSAQRDLIITGTTRPACVEVVTTGGSPARSEIERAVRELVGAVPELTWTDGGAGSGNETSSASRPSQVVIDVSDLARVRIEATHAGDSRHSASSPVPPPIVREVVIAGLSPEVARETIAQIVQTTVRALLDPSASASAARASALEPSPLQPVVAAPPVVIIAQQKADSVAAPRSRPAMDVVVGALIPLNRDNFPFPAAGSLTQHPIDGVALSIGHRYPVLTTTARLSGELNDQSNAFVRSGQQMLMATVGTAAHLDRGDLSFALGVDVGAVLVRQTVSVDSAQTNVMYSSQDGSNDNWWSGPLVALRGTVDFNVSPRVFLRFEAGVSAVALKPKHDWGNTAWQGYEYTQLVLGAGYAF